MKNSLQNREYLIKRHRLSHRQIDNLLGENRSKEFINTSIQSLEFIKHFIELIDILNEHNISYISFKGPLLSQQIYGDPTVRFSHDIDILVDKNCMNEINKVLLDAGYSYIGETIWPDNKNQIKILMDSIQHLGYLHSQHGLMVEIHWTLSITLPVTLPILQKVISWNKNEEFFYGRKIMTFSPEFNLLYLIIHGSKHGWQRLKWLVDIKDYPYDKIDQQKFEELIKIFHAQRIVSQTYVILMHYLNYNQPMLFKTKVPNRILKYVYAFMDNPIYENQGIKDSISFLMYKLLLFKNTYYKFSVFTDMMISSHDAFKIKSSYKIVYFIYRPYSYIKRRVYNAT